MDPAAIGRDRHGGSCCFLAVMSRYRKAQAAVICNVSLTQMEGQPQEPHSNSICYILQESKHSYIISTQHKACFILGIQTTTGLYQEQISRLLINSTHDVFMQKHRRLFSSLTSRHNYMTVKIAVFS